MYEVFGDFHVHIGRSENGKPMNPLYAPGCQISR